MSDARPWSEACERNKAPIAEVLADYLRPGGRLLEIGSGTGQHAVHIAAAHPGVRWLTSDLPANHTGILAWLAQAALPNVEAPLALDTRDHPWPLGAPVDLLFSANTAHIMGWDGVCGLFQGAGQWLQRGGKMLIYGPFSFGGRHVSESNSRFDAALRARDPAMGVRDMEDLEAQAAQAGLAPHRLHRMPANNFIVVWQRC